MKSTGQMALLRNNECHRPIDGPRLVEAKQVLRQFRCATEVCDKNRAAGRSKAPHVRTTGDHGHGARAKTVEHFLRDVVLRRNQRTWC